MHLTKDGDRRLGISRPPYLSGKNGMRLPVFLCIFVVCNGHAPAQRTRFLKNLLLVCYDNSAWIHLQLFSTKCAMHKIRADDPFYDMALPSNGPP